MTSYKYLFDLVNILPIFAMKP